MGWWKYEKTIFWRALRRTLDTYGELFQAGVLMRQIVQTVIAILILYMIGEKTQINDEVVWILAICGGLVGSVLLTFFMAWASEPYRLYRESETEILNLKSKISPLDLYASWDSKDPLTILEAGCLWAGVEPDDPVPSGPSRPLVSRLLHAAKAQKLDTNTDTLALTIANLPFGDGQEARDRLVKGSTTVSRSALKEYAAEHNERPLFLYPEDRDGYA